MKNHKIYPAWAGFFVLIGAALTAVGLWFVWLSPKSYELAVWFQVEKGKAILRRANYQEELMAHGQHDIHEGDSLLLDDISTGILVIPAHQARIRLLESTELNLARAPGGRWLIRLTKGDLEVLEGDQLDRIFIEDAHGNIVNLSKWGWDRTKNETPESTPSTKSKTLAYYEGEELHNIDESYQKLRPQLLKCYSKWHQDSDSSLVQLPINVLFKLQYKKTGVSSITIQSSTHIPDTIKECFRQTLLQFRLPYFRGSSIDVELPLILE